MNEPKAALFLSVLLILFGSIFVSAQASANTGLTYKAPGDFDGDGKTDIAIYRPDNGQWWIQRSSDGSHYVVTFGLNTDKPIPYDYTGDGKADIAIWRPSSGEWFILRSEDFSYYSIPFGLSSDIPVPADYDGDDKTDLAVWRPSNATWYIQKSSGGYDIVTFGISSDIPAPADFDGDGKADIAASRVTSFWIRQTSDNSVYAVPFGNFSNQQGFMTNLFPGDFTGDGKADQALYTNVVHNWCYRNQVTGSETCVNRNFVDGLIPVPGDYDGDHKLDVAMFNLNNYRWTIYYTGGNVVTTWGINGDVPIPYALTLMR